MHQPPSITNNTHACRHAHTHSRKRTRKHHHMARRKLKQKCLTGVSLQCLLLTSDRITLGLLQVSLVSNGMIFTTASFFEHMGRWLDNITAKLLSYHFFFEALFTHLFPYRLCPSCSRYLHPHINVQ